MNAKTLLMLAVTAAAFGAGPSVAQGDDRDRDRAREMDLDQFRDRDRIYGFDVMTPEEHDTLFRRLQEAQDEQERMRIMEEHRHAMRERVRALLGVIGEGPGPHGPGGGRGSRGN